MKHHPRPAGAKLGIPWQLGWQCDFRRTFSRRPPDGEKISIGERKELMGHTRAEMTLHYTNTPTDQARAVLDSLAEKIVNAANLETANMKKVIRMKKAAGQ